ARFVTDQARLDFSPESVDVDGDPKSISHVWLCDAFDEDEIRTHLPKGSETWRRVRQNQDDRYHHLDAAPINPPDDSSEEGNASVPEEQGVVGLLQKQGISDETALDGPTELPDLFLDFKKALALPTRQ